MAKSTPIWFSIPEWYGIQQQVDGTLLPVTSAYDARNMETGDGNLSVAKGYTKHIATQVPGSEKILKLITSQGRDNFYVVTIGHIYAWVYDEDTSTWGWDTIWTFSDLLGASQVDVLQTRIGISDVILVATGQSLTYNGSTYGMVKIDTKHNTADVFGAGLYSYEGTVASYDSETQIITLNSPGMSEEAQRGRSLMAFHTETACTLTWRLFPTQHTSSY